MWSYEKAKMGHYENSKMYCYENAKIHYDEICLISIHMSRKKVVKGGARPFQEN